MHRISVGFAENSDRFNAHFTTGADDANSDFAAIGDQDFLKHSIL